MVALLLSACGQHQTARLDRPHTEFGLIAVGPNVPVTSDRPEAAHTEYFADADQRDANMLLACSMVIDPPRSTLSSALYLSADGGRNWRVALVDTVGRYGSAWDPACAFGPDGMAYFAVLPKSLDPRVVLSPQTRIFRSTDRGKSWDTPVSAPVLHNEYLAVDWSEGPTRGRVYVVGARRSLSLIYSDDAGRTYKEPVELFLPDSLLLRMRGAPLVLNDGRLFVPVTVARRQATGRPPAIESPAQETTNAFWTAVVPLLNNATRLGLPIRITSYAPCPDYNQGGSPVLALDRSSGPFRDRIYYVYADRPFGRCQIMLSWSDDGTKWSTPIAVDDPPVPLDSGRGPDAFLPQVAVNDKGVVGMTWYDRRDDPQNLAFRQRFTASLDGGESVLPSVAVSTASHTYASGNERERYFGLGSSGLRGTGAAWMAVSTGIGLRTYNVVGDYGGMAVAANGVFHAMWVDNRTGVPRLHTAPVTVTGAAKRRADWDEGMGTNVSDSVAFIVTSSVFDPKTCSIRLRFDVMNRSQRPLSMPLVAKVERMMSQLGVPRLADGARDEMGRPVWTIGMRGMLAPDSVVSSEANVVLNECTTLAGRMPSGGKVDARMNATPVAGLGGAKMFAVEVRVFEARTTAR